MNEPCEDASSRSFPARSRRVPDTNRRVSGAFPALTGHQRARRRKRYPSSGPLRPIACTLPVLRRARSLRASPRTQSLTGPRASFRPAATACGGTGRFPGGLDYLSQPPPHPSSRLSPLPCRQPVPHAAESGPADRRAACPQAVGLEADRLAHGCGGRADPRSWSAAAKERAGPLSTCTPTGTSS